MRSLVGYTSVVGYFSSVLCRGNPTARVSRLRDRLTLGQKCQLLATKLDTVVVVTNIGVEFIALPFSGTFL